MQSHRLSVLGIALVVVIMGCALFYRTYEAKQEIQQLEAQETKLEAQLTKEETRHDELEEQKAYVQTLQYVEEMAKKLGLVYSDEIIYKPNDN